MTVFPARSNQSSNSLSFKQAISSTQSILNQAGVPCVGFHDESLPHYRRLSVAQQTEALSEITNYLSTLEQAIEMGWSLNDDKRLLWAALKILNLTPTSDIFELLPTDSTIEVYNLNNIQIWRNLKYMEICSYTLEEMFCYSWQERYERDPEAISQILYFVERTLNSRSPKTEYSPVHNVIQETFSADRFILDTQHELISPVMKGNVAMGFIVASKVQIIGSDKQAQHSPSMGPLLTLV